MPQVSLRDLKLSGLGDRIRDAADDARPPDTVRQKLDDAAGLLGDVGEWFGDAGNRVGSEVGERLGDVRWSAPGLPAALRVGPALRSLKMDIPNSDARKLRRAISKIDIPQVTIGKPKAGPPVVRLVLVAGVAGAFLGWWLATSSFSSGRVRSLVRQARARLGMRPERDVEAAPMTLRSERGSKSDSDPGGAASSSDVPNTSALSGPSHTATPDGGSLRAHADAVDGGFRR